TAGQVRARAAVVARPWVQGRMAALKRAWSDGQALAPLGATTGQDGATGTGCHARTEAVGALAVQIAGLVCTLHAGSRRKSALKPLHAVRVEGRQGYACRLWVSSTATLPQIRGSGVESLWITCLASV